VVALAVAAGVYLGNQMLPKESAWEYKLESVSFPTFERGERWQERDVYEAFLDRHGNDGWEIIAVVPTKDGYHALYKRPCDRVSESYAKMRLDNAINDASK
jgi:hypothetical protein